MNQEKTTMNVSDEHLRALKEAESNNDDNQNHPDVIRWASGGFFILLGAIFFLWQSDLSVLGDSPWMLFLLIPMYWILVGAYRTYLHEGRAFTPAVVRALVWGIFPFLFLIVGSVIGWNVAWPIVLIAIGITAIAGQKLS